MALDRKIAYIDLSTNEIQTKSIPISIRHLYLGGRGLDAYLLYNHLKPRVDALSPANVLLVSAGFLTGTLASASSRTHVAAKSPLTNYFGSTNMGGYFGPEMRWAGFDHLVIKGKAPKPVYLWINNGTIEIKDASQFWGKDSFETQKLIKEKLDDEDAQVMCIGTAGENLVRFACVRTGYKSSGGRTGMGAVMGSKNLKAIVIRGTMDLKIAHPDEALEYDKKIIDKVTSSKVAQIMQRWGTMFIYDITNSTGLIRTRNFQLNQLEGGDGLECENIDKYSIGTSGCFGCGIHCRHKYIIKSGPYAGTYGEGPEYTSLGAFGAEVGCNNMETVLIGNHLVNDYGMDTLEVGSLIAWAMELYEKGIITKKDTGGLKLDWGNEDAVIELVHQISQRKGLGNILAEGPLRAAKKLGKASLKYLIHVKGMSNLHSDERPTPSLALGIATSSRGADHLRSRPAIDLYHLPKPVLDKIYRSPSPYKGPLSSDYTSYNGKARMVQWQEMCYMAVDCLGVCKYHTIFLSPNMPSFEEFSQLIYFNTGLEISPLEIWQIADRAYTMERLFNIREGLTRKDDWLVNRYFDEPTSIGLDIVKGKKLNRAKFRMMINEYYQLHGWDKNGKPKSNTLKKLKLDKEPSHTL